MISRRVVLSGLGAGLAGTTFIAQAPFVRSQPALKPLKMRMTYTPFGFHASIFLAVERGWFRDAGVDVQIEDGSGTTAAINLTAAQKIDVGEGAVSAMAAARPSGINLIAIACIVPGTDIGVLVPKDSGIKTPKDLEGKKLGYSSGSLEAPFLEPFLLAGKADPKKVETVAIDVAAKFPTYISKQVDAVAGSLPYVYPYIQKQRPSDTMMFGDYGFYLPSFGYFVREQTIKEKRAELTGFITGIRKAWHAILVDGKEQEGIDALVKNRPQISLTQDILKGQIDAYLPLMSTPNTKGHPIGWQARKDWEDCIDTLQSAKMLPATAKPEDFYTNDFIVGA